MNKPPLYPVYRVTIFSVPSHTYSDIKKSLAAIKPKHPKAYGNYLLVNDTFFFQSTANTKIPTLKTLDRIVAVCIIDKEFSIFYFYYGNILEAVRVDYIANRLCFT